MQPSDCTDGLKVYTTYRPEIFNSQVGKYSCTLRKGIVKAADRDIRDHFPLRPHDDRK
jgi:hypothetical protein